MRLSLSLVFGAMCCLSAFAADHASHSQKGSAAEAANSVYGKGIRLEGPSLSLKEAAKNLSKEREVLIKARINQVCQSKGCWMMLEDGDLKTRVTFEDYSFFIPKNTGGKTALVQGKIFEKEISAAEARHYAKDAKMPKEEVAKIKSPQKSIWVEASGIKIE